MTASRGDPAGEMEPARGRLITRRRAQPQAPQGNRREFAITCSRYRDIENLILASTGAPASCSRLVFLGVTWIRRARPRTSGISPIEA